MITREFVQVLKARMAEKNPLIQVVLGPRQVGKTTGVLQMIEAYRSRSVYTSADDTLTASTHWLEDQWQSAREKGAGAILVIDEIQKIHNWAETIKKLWDAQKRSPVKMKCVLLGSSSLKLHKGLTESLAGRFELIPVYHWNYQETHQAFGDDLESFITFGGYPAAHAYQKDYTRWFSYVKSSIVDVVVGQDILSQHTVTKPALFRQAFEILCGYPAQEVSYTTLLGQLQDKGNTEMVKHYLELYEGAFLFRGLAKYSGKIVRTKTSSPKIIPMCPALYTLASGLGRVNDPETRGHVFEAVVGSDLLRVPEGTVTYWRDGDREVDFVFRNGADIYAVEVKSGRKRSASGITLFKSLFAGSKACIIHRDNYLDFASSPLAFLKAMAH